MTKRVLIADDSSFMRRMMRNCFEGEPSFAVCGEAADGIEAISMAQELRPDLIVLDLSMPRMNGIDAARALQPVLPMTPKILFTSYTDVVSEQVARSAGVSAVLSKTDGIDKLMKEIRRLLIAKQQIQDPGLQSSDRINFVPANQTKEPTREQIQQRAYELFIERGCEQGRDIDDWLAAEKELDELLADQVLRAAGTQLSAEQDPRSESQVGVRFHGLLDHTLPDETDQLGSHRIAVSPAT
jgi:DNA-binding NarL/FixJ family response regulator